MPPRTPTLRRRNPDPQTLREYLHQHIVNLLIQDGAEVNLYPLNLCEVFYPDQGTTFDLDFDYFGTLFAIPRPRSSSNEIGNIVRALASAEDRARNEIGDVVRALASVADRAGVSIIVRVAGSVGWVRIGNIENARLIRPTTTGTTGITMRVIVPAVVKNKQQVADAYLKSIESSLRGTSPGTAGVTLARAFAESQPVFASVPKKYRKQVAELFRSAFEQDDLGTYLQARELAALVSE